MNASLLATITALSLGAASSLVVAAPQGTTRADVRAELKALHDVGYTTASDNTRYPVSLQMAQAKLDQRRMNQVAADSAHHDGGMPAVDGGAPSADNAMAAPASTMTRNAAYGAPLFDRTFRGQ